jgi:hypothetical protein
MAPLGAAGKQDPPSINGQSGEASAAWGVRIAIGPAKATHHTKDIKP